MLSFAFIDTSSGREKDKLLEKHFPWVTSVFEYFICRILAVIAYPLVQYFCHVLSERQFL